MIERFTHQQFSADHQKSRAQVIDILAALLSSRAPASDRKLIAKVPLLGFGVPCWQLPQCDLEKVCKDLSQRINLHLPDLSNVNVTITNSSDNNKLAFIVEGWLAIESSKSHIQYSL